MKGQGIKVITIHSVRTVNAYKCNILAIHPTVTVIFYSGAKSCHERLALPSSEPCLYNSPTGIQVSWQSFCLITTEYL